MSDFAQLFTFNVHYSRFYFKRRGAEAQRFFYPKTLSLTSYKRKDSPTRDESFLSNRVVRLKWASL